MYKCEAWEVKVLAVSFACLGSLGIEGRSTSGCCTWRASAASAKTDLAKKGAAAPWLGAAMLSKSAQHHATLWILTRADSKSNVGAA